MSKLLGKNRKLVETVEVEVDGEKVKIDLRKPSVGEVMKTVSAGKLAGELDAEGKLDEADPLKGMSFVARALIMVAYDPETKRPLFKAEQVPDIVEEDWFLSIGSKIMAAFSVEPEAIKGK
ncbi:hypothetical protein ACN28S_29985 [Cystobacter fuscus]